MTDDDILRMAREAGGAWEYNRSHPVPCVMYDEELIKFARLVAAAEREAIIDIIEDYHLPRLVIGNMMNDIRARGENR